MTEEALKTVKMGLELCYIHIMTGSVENVCGRCPYYRQRLLDIGCRATLMSEAKDALRELEDMNTEGTPIAKAKWKAWYHGWTNDGSCIDYTCSNCGRPSDVRERYCPNCGSPMETPEEAPRGE